MNPFTVMYQMAVLFLMIAVGFVAGRRGIMGQASENYASKLIVNITNPALIISSVATANRLDSDRTIAVVFLTAVIYYLALPFAARGLSKVLHIGKDIKSQFEAMLVFANIGFMGIPVADAVLGKQAVLYISIFVAVFNVAFFSYGVVLLGENGQKQSATAVLKKVINPGTLAAVFAVCLYLCRWTLPGLIVSPLTSLGGITTPLAMLIIGSSLARNPMGQMLKDKGLYLYSAVRLFLIPAVVIFLGKFLIADNLLYQVLVLISAMPAASLVVMTRNDFGKNSDFSAKATVFSTFFCVVTIPMVVVFMSFVASI